MESTETQNDQQVITVQRPNGPALLSAADTMLAGATSFVIDSNEMFEIANEELRDVKARHDQLEAQEKSLTAPLTTVIEGIRDLFRAPKARLKQAEGIYKNSLLAYSNKKAEEQREAQRIANEAAAAQRREQEQIARDAAAAALQAQARGDVNAAVELQEQAEAAAATAHVISAPAVQIAAPKIAGLVTRKSWECELPANDEDKLKLLTFIVANPQFLHLVDVSKSACNAQAKALKGNLAIPGLRAVEKSNLAVGK